MNCGEAEDLIPAYALGALESVEREELEQHLDLCSSCSRVLRDHLEATAVLARTLPTAEPPPTLWNRILDRLGEQPARVAAAIPAPEAAKRTKGRRRRRASAVGLSLAASFALVFVGVLVALVLQLQGQLAGMQEENQHLITMIEQQRSLSYTAALPGTEVMLLANTELAPRARGMLMTSSDHRWGYVVAQGLQPPGEGLAYQIWLVGRDSPVSGGVFNVDASGYGQRFVRLSRPLDYYAGIQITVEPQQGSPYPLGKQVLSASFP